MRPGRPDARPDRLLLCSEGLFAISAGLLPFAPVDAGLSLSTAFAGCIFLLLHQNAARAAAAAYAPGRIRTRIRFGNCRKKLLQFSGRFSPVLER